MKKVQIKKQRLYSENENVLNLAIMIIFFLCGIAAGCIIAAYSASESNLFSLNDGILAVTQQGDIVRSFGRTYFNLIKYPSVIFILGFTAFGYFTIPPIVSLKGFFTAFSISAVMKLYGTKGFWLAFAMFGIQSFFSIPVVLLISSLAFEVSKLFGIRLRPAKKAPVKDKRTFTSYIIFFAVSMLVMLFFAFLDIAITPSLVSLSLKSLT